jgi:hypothetical protein
MPENLPLIPRLIKAIKRRNLHISRKLALAFANVLAHVLVELVAGALFFQLLFVLFLADYGD